MLVALRHHVRFHGKEAKKNIAESIELHLSAPARDGIPLTLRRGVKETFVTVDI